MYGILGGTAGNVIYGGNVNPPRNRKGVDGNPPPKDARASVLPDPEKLLAWNRGHWSVETKNHYIRDTTFGEDACRSRVGSAPANNAICANIALAIIFHNKFSNAAEARRHFALNRADAFEAVCSPG